MRALKALTFILLLANISPAWPIAQGPGLVIDKLLCRSVCGCRILQSERWPMIKIYGMSGSPFVRRTELVLTEKGVDYKLITLSRADGDLQSPEHLARNPRGRVPVLEDGDLILYESQAIVEYLEDRYPEPALVPADFGDRGHMRVAEMECLIYFGGVR